MTSAQIIHQEEQPASRSRKVKKSDEKQNHILEKSIKKTKKKKERLGVTGNNESHDNDDAAKLVNEKSSVLTKKKKKSRDSVATAGDNKNIVAPINDQTLRAHLVAIDAELLAKRLTATVEQVKIIVKQMIKAHTIDRRNAGQVVRAWRCMQRRRDSAANRRNEQQSSNKKIGSTSSVIDDLTSNFVQNLNDVKALVNKNVHSGQLERSDAANVVNKWKHREKRRLQRQSDKFSKSVCFNCREPGHRLAECPNSIDSGSNDQQHITGICFKCGSTEHTSSRCQRKNVKGFPYATCFVCKRHGHLSRDCDDNANGIYPDGGSCNLCGSQKHLKRECPSMKSISETDVGQTEEKKMKKPTDGIRVIRF